MGRGVNKTCVWGKEVCGPGTVIPLICEDPFVTIDELIEVSQSEFSAWVCL